MNGGAWGGSEELWSQTASHLRAAGETVGVNVLRWPETPVPIKQLETGGCAVERRSELGRGAKLRNALRPQANFAWLDRFQPDLAVISQGAHIDGAPWMLACKKRGVPYVSIAHSAGEQWWPDDGEAQSIAEAYEGARAAYFVSNGNLDLTRRQLAIPLEHARIVRNPFSIPYDIEVEWPEYAEELRLACVGRLAPSAKGQDLLFDVLRQQKWRNRPLRLTLYGSGPNEATLRAMARLYHLDAVTFGGFETDITAIWRSHHALVLPSRFEGLPITIVEAMLCARICIVTDVAGNRELLEDGASGFVAAGPSASLLDAALERAWAQRKQWRAMGLKAAAQVRTHIPADPVAVFVEEIRTLL